MRCSEPVLQPDPTEASMLHSIANHPHVKSDVLVPNQEAGHHLLDSKTVSARFEHQAARETVHQRAIFGKNSN